MTHPLIDGAVAQIPPGCGRRVPPRQGPELRTRRPWESPSVGIVDHLTFRNLSCARRLDRLTLCNCVLAKHSAQIPVGLNRGLPLYGISMTRGLSQAQLTCGLRVLQAFCAD